MAERIESLTVRISVPKFRIFAVRAWIWCVGYPLVLMRIMGRASAEAYAAKLLKWVTDGVKVEVVK